jgi:hypothetical protein
MNEFDVTQPILLQKGSNRIIAGHGRFEAFKARGMKEVPVIYLDMDDKRAKAYALIDNQTTINEGWNDKLLDELLEELKFEIPELDMTKFGFEDPNPKDIVEDDVPDEYDSNYGLNFKTTKDQAEIITEELHRLREENGEEELNAGWRERNLTRMAERSKKMG